MRSLRIVLIATSLLAFAACSRGFESERLGVKFEPPSSISFDREEAGVAVFSPGLEIRSIPGKPPSVEERQLRATLEEIRAGSGVALPGEIASARAGTLPAGPVARYELTTRGARTLLYVLPAKDRYVLLTLTAPEPEFSRLQNQFERSLSTLALR